MFYYVLFSGILSDFGIWKSGKKGRCTKNVKIGVL